MSSSGPVQARLRGGTDYAELSQLGLVNVATITTTSISSGATGVQFEASEDDSQVDTVNLTPSDAILPKRARIVSIKPNVSSGSTDMDVKLVQSDTFNEIDQVVNVSGVNVNEEPSGYVLGGGLGTPFANKQEENAMYFEVDENSGNSTVLQIEVAWYGIN